MAINKLESFVLFATVAASALFDSVSSKIENEKQLARYIIGNYEKIADGRPVSNWTDALDVRMAVSMHHIVLNGKHLKAALLVYMSWKDEFLVWDPKSFSGQNTIVLPAKHFWKPDLSNWRETRDNKADQAAEMEIANVVVESNGSVRWFPRFTTETECIEDPTSQTGKLNCSFVFGSWSYTSEQLDLFIDESLGMDVKELQLPPGIEILENTATKTNWRYPCCSETYVEAAYKLVVRQWGQCNKPKTN